MRRTQQRGQVAGAQLQLLAVRLQHPRDTRHRARLGSSRFGQLLVLSEQGDLMRITARGFLLDQHFDGAILPTPGSGTSGIFFTASQELVQGAAPDCHPPAREACLRPPDHTLGLAAAQRPLCRCASPAAENSSCPPFGPDHSRRTPRPFANARPTVQSSCCPQ